MRRCIKIEDLIGRTFGRLKVIERDYSKTRKDVEYYRCECRCGNNNYITTAKELLSGKGSCGCIKKNKGFNDYKIEGDTTIIYVEKRNGNIHEVLISTEDLDALIELDWRWHTDWQKCTKTYYATYSQYMGKINNKFTYKYNALSRILLHVEDSNIIVDHKNHNTLDNRRGNLRETVISPNSRHRENANSNNKSGFRNVSWNGSGWSVQLMVEGKNTCLKRFKKDQLKEAGAYAEKMRQELYGEFAGGS